MLGAGDYLSRTALEIDWATAANDAGIDPTTVVLYPLPATGDYSAQYFPPGRSPQSWQDEFAFSDSDRDALQRLEHRHVLVVDEDTDEPRRVLLLRHEAEHVLQQQSSPAAEKFAHQLAIALRPGANWLYFAMPHEREADAAATSFRRASDIQPTQDDLEGRDRMLYDAPWAAPDPGSLPLRLLAFSLFYPDDFDVACTSSQYWPHVDPDELIEAMIPGGADARRPLRNALNGWIEQLTDHGITQERWDAMSRAEQNAVTDELRQQVVDREQETVEELQARL